MEILDSMKLDYKIYTVCTLFLRSRKIMDVRTCTYITADRMCVQHDLRVVYRKENEVDGNVLWWALPGRETNLFVLSLRYETRKWQERQE